MVAKVIIIGAVIAVAVLCTIWFLVPFINDITSGVDPAARYEDKPNVEFAADTISENTSSDTVTEADWVINEVKSNYSIKNDPYYDNGRIIFSTDNDTSNGIMADAVAIYDVASQETTILPNVTKKYDNIIMTRLSGNYAIWVDCMKAGGGRICGYDLSKQEMFVVKEFGYAIPYISINGNYIAFTQVAGENEQRLYLYDIANRTNTTVKIYESKDVTCGKCDISDTSLVWSEYATDGRAVLRVLDLTGGTAQPKEYNLGDWVFKPRTNGEYILYTTRDNSLEADLMLSDGNSNTVRVATGVLEYEIGEDYIVYSKGEQIFAAPIDKAQQSQLVSGDMMRAMFSSFNGKHLCFYDVTDNFGQIDSVRYVYIDREEN